MKIDELVANPALLTSESAIAANLTPERIASILERSSEGEGVMRILVDMGLNPYAGTEWLRKNRQADIIEAKKEQLRRRRDKEPR